MPSEAKTDWYKETLKQRRNQRRQARKALYPVSCGLCAYCLQPVSYQSSIIEHMIPKSRGGSNEHDNLAIACKKCDSRKKDATPLEFMYLNGYKLESI